MGGSRRRRSSLAARAIAGAALLATVTPAAGAAIFDRVYVDLAYGGNGRPGWARAGDMDGDGDLDIVAGGGYALFIYENDGAEGGWMRHGSLDGASAIGANGAVLLDADADGDLDVVSARYYDDLGWWENPGPPLASAAWEFHVLSSETRYLHDMIVADLDLDGVAEEVVANLNSGYWSAAITIKWFRPGADPEAPWEAHVIEANRNEGPPHGHAGLDTGDLDGDGDVDLAYANGWYESPADPAGTWTWRQLTTIYGISNALFRDLDLDGDLDLVVSAGHHGSGVYWLEAPDDPVAGAWTSHTIDAAIHHPECLAVLDLDGDDDRDVVTCDLFFGEDPGEPGWGEQVHNVYVLENLGAGGSWALTNVAPDGYPSHLLQPVDLDDDGKVDLISEATGTSVVTFYPNVTPGPGCLDDELEPDDACAAARPAGLGVAHPRRQCDPDWFAVETVTGATYEAVTTRLAGGADTFLELVDPGCGAFVAADDDSGPDLGSLIEWTSVGGGRYGLGVTAADGYAHGRTYDLVVECILDCGLCASPESLDLTTETVTGTEVHEACSTIKAGPDFTVAAGGHLTLRAGHAIALHEGFRIAGGSVRIEIDRSLR